MNPYNILTIGYSIILIEVAFIVPLLGRSIIRKNRKNIIIYTLSLILSLGCLLVLMSCYINLSY
jgi:hypothetical protein